MSDHTCPTCEGTGGVLVNMTGDTGTSRNETDCPSCDGSGLEEDTEEEADA